MKTNKHIYTSLIIMVLLLSIITCSAQKKSSKVNTNQSSEPICKITDKTDEFTKERAVASGPYQIYSEKVDLIKSSLSEWDYKHNSDYKSTTLNFYIYARWENGKKVIGLIKYVWQVNDYLDFPQNDPDPKIIFLLSNEEALTLIPTTIESAKLNDGGWVSQREIFEVNDSIWSKLKDFPPIKFRIRYLGTDYPSIYTKDFVIEEQFKGQIPFTLKCIDDLNLPK
jgi:hypothetical protein